MGTVVILYGLMLLAVVYGVTFLLLSSLHYTNNLKGAALNEGDTLVYGSSGVSGLRAQRAFLEARTMLVNADSVSLAVNLSDSTITLEQKGVVLHSAPIHGLKVSRVFGRVHQSDLAMVLSSPMNINDSWSTIPRKRYSLKQAPSDTSAAVPMVMPDTSSREEVSFRLSLDRGIQLDFRQMEYSDHKDGKRLANLINRQESVRIMKDLLAFRVPEYHPVIRLELSEKDARTIYKALPVHAQVALRI